MDRNNELIDAVIKAFEKNGFAVIKADTALEAGRMLLEKLSPTETVGVGGSVSVRETGVLDALKTRGQKLYDHWACAPGDSVQVRQSAMTADAYLCSCNAVTREGHLVYIDGNGNRVGAVAYGPKRLFVVIGENKLVDGGLAAAVARIKREACAPNARRLGRDTPCAKTGACHREECLNSMCSMTFVLTGAPAGREITIILVGQKLGY